MVKNTILTIYLLMILSITPIIRAQEAATSEPEKPVVKQQPTTWSRIKRWGLYVTGTGAAILGAYAIYKTTVGKKAPVIPSTPALSLLVQFHDKLDPVKSFKVLDEKVKEFKEQDEKHREFVESTQGQLVYKQTKAKINNNINEAQMLVEGLGLQLPTFNTNTYDTERYLNSLLVHVLLNSERPPELTPSTFYSDFSRFRNFTDQDLNAFKKLLELGANPESATSSDVLVTLDACRKFMQDYKKTTAKPDQLPYDREIIKVLVLNGGRIREPSRIAALMEADPELRQFFKEQGYSDNGLKYKSWWK